MSRSYMLIGMHHNNIRRLYEVILNSKGYEVVVCENLDCMREFLSKSNFVGCVMDANLGMPGSDDFSPAKEVYATILEKLNHIGTDKIFLSITGSDQCYALVKAAGIPVEKNIDSIRKLEGLLENIKEKN